MERWTCYVLVVFLIGLAVMGCPGPETNLEQRDYRQDMRDFVHRISDYAKAKAPGFSVIPQNGHQLLTEDGQESGPSAKDYLAAIDAVGREDLFYGYDGDDVATSNEDRDPMLAFMDLAEENGVEVLVTDYCSTREHVDNSYLWNAAHGFVSFAADHRELDNIPTYPPLPANDNNVTKPADARNFLYLLDPGGFSSKQDFLDALAATGYDLFFDEGPLTAAEVASLREKPQGGSRLVIAYMSIGEAENYRYYWQEDWAPGAPVWLVEENPDWEGNFIVRYWESEWQDIILGDSGAYLDRILAAGFDGVYLDIIDAFECFE